MSLQSPLGKALGRGSAKSGVSHWWSQRVTAVELVPLTLWFAFQDRKSTRLNSSHVSEFRMPSSA